MKLDGIVFVTLGILMVAACGETTDPVESSREAIVGPSTLGGRNEVVMLFARVVLANGSIGTRTCSGGYFAPRVVATAAHCLPNILGNELLVYYGDPFDADFALLTADANGVVVPPPG